jgi:1-aminocyclopropane-1-carboxylate deaminase/D-cysteine desulfhydrase-like pyridoxal-dependent ACC family enzyme
MREKAVTSVSRSASEESLGTYPTRVERLDGLSSNRATLWIKRDDRTSALYGGNKVRKLERVLADARARGASRLVTIGAVGSHHVLATAIFGARAGFEVDAVLVPQPASERALRNVRAAIAAGARVLPARTWAGALWRVARARMSGAYFVALGGSSVVGSMAYVDAARELAMQVRAGELLEPDVIVVAAGSGGTAAGLAAGLAAERMKTRVVAVAIATPLWSVAWLTRRLARACARRAGARFEGGLDARLVIDARWCGAGYAVPTDAGTRAVEAARACGIALDATYTGKALAAALERVHSAAAESGQPREGAKGANVLFWHTLSSAPMDPLLAGAPAEDALDPRVRALLVVHRS